jgi:hypothetical protein
LRLALMLARDGDRGVVELARCGARASSPFRSPVMADVSICAGRHRAGTGEATPRRRARIKADSQSYSAAHA